MHRGNSVEYRYKFCEVPFRSLAIAERARERCAPPTRNIDRPSGSNFGTALSDEGNPHRIDVFGSYPHYSPLVFDSVLEPVAQQWDARPPQGRAAGLLALPPGPPAGRGAADVRR